MPVSIRQPLDSSEKMDSMNMTGAGRERLFMKFRIILKRSIHPQTDAVTEILFRSAPAGESGLASVFVIWAASGFGNRYPVITADRI